MAVIHTRVDPIDRDVNLMISRDLSPAGQSQILAATAQAMIDEGRATNRRILGRDTPVTVTVDGRKNAPITSVRPNGVVVAEFELIFDLLQYIGAQLEAFSPILTGRYQKSHTLFADGVEVPLGAQIPAGADEYAFVSPLPYARKIERGFSTQAPEGVYQVVAALARRRYGSNIARITYSFRTAIGGRFIGGRIGDRSPDRNPAIIVRFRS